MPSQWVIPAPIMRTASAPSRLNRRAAQRRAVPVLSIIIPALNEAENLALLVPRLGRALKGIAFEILVVDDDSRDTTLGVCAALGQAYPVRLLMRRTARNGLAGAVLHGLSMALGQYLLVMDADLQHPPESVPALLDVLHNEQAEFVIGSRYCDGGQLDGKWSLLRRTVSWVATLLARPVAGRVRDPMSGFFALTRAAYERAGEFNPTGFKIALELLNKCRVRDVREIPIDFGTRQHGHSKLSLREQWRYLVHLARLYNHTYPVACITARIALLVGVGSLILLSLV